MDDLLYLVHSDGAERLKLVVGQPPIVVMDGEAQAIEGPAMTAEQMDALLHSVTDTRQRRELREHGEIEFFYRFRQCTSFVINAKARDGDLFIEIH